MTDGTPSPSSKTRLVWGLALLALLLAGALIALAYSWSQAQQAVVWAEMALATTTAQLGTAERSRATAEAGQGAAAAIAQAELATAQATVQAELAAAQATVQAEVVVAQATAQAEVAAAQATVVAAQNASAAAEATAQARQAEALAAAADEADAQARQSESYRLAAAALANLPNDPAHSLLLATDAVSTSLAEGKEVPLEIVETLRQAVWAHRLDSRLEAGHTGPVNDVAFSPDGNFLATVGDDGTVRVWEAASGGQVLTLVHSSAGLPVYSAAFSPTDDRLATASFDQTAKIWDAKTGRELLTLTGHKDWVVGVAFSPANGDTIATGSQDGTAILWDAKTGKLLLTLAPSSGGTGGHSAAINRLAFNPTGDRLATASDDGAVIIWDTQSGQDLLTLEGHSGPVYDVAFDVQGDRLASASIDGTVKIWESDSGREVRTLRHSRTGWATSVAFNLTGDWLASAGEDGRVVIWDAVSGQERFTLPGHTGAINGLALSAVKSAANSGGERLASASADGQVRLWQISGNEASLILPPLANHRGPVYGVAANSRNQLATSSGDGSVKIWEITPDQNRLVHTLVSTGTTGALYALAFSPDGDTLAAAGEDGSIAVWGTTPLTLAKADAGAKLMLTGQNGPIYALAFNRDSILLASAGEDGTARLWDTITGESVGVLPSPEEADENPVPLYSLAFNPAGTLLAAAGRNGLVKVWEVESSQQVASLPSNGIPVRALAFYPAPPNAANSETGDLLALGGDDGSVRLWRVGQSLRVLPGAGAAIQALAFSPDHSRLAATAADGGVTIWSLASGQVLLRLTPPTEVRAGYGLAFLPDGDTLVTGSQTVSSGSALSAQNIEGTALRWDITAGDLLSLYSLAPVNSLALAGPASTDASSPKDRLVTAGADGLVRRWQIERGTGRWSAAPSGNKGTTTGVFQADEKVVLTSIAGAGDYLAAGDDTGAVWLWAADSGRVLATVAVHTGPVNDLALVSSPEITQGGRLITAGQDDTIKVWIISPAGAINNRPQLTLAGHTGDISAVALSPASTAADLLATASHDGTARLWDLGESGREVITLTGHVGWLNDLAFNARGDRVATAGEDGTVRVWDVASGKELLRLASAEGLNGPVKSVAFGLGANEEERLAARTGDGTVLVWSLQPGPNSDLSVQSLLRLAPSLGGQPNHLAFDPSGRALITAGDDGVVRFYALEVDDLINLP